MQILKHKSLSDEESKLLDKNLIAGNKVLCKWYLKVLHNRGITNKELSKIAFRKELFIAIDADCKVDNILIPKNDVRLLNKVRSAQDTAIASFTKMAMKLSKKWHGRVNGDYPSLWDFYADAIVALIESIYGYDGSTKLTTYVWHSMHNRLLDVYNEGSPLSPLVTKDRKLMQLMSETKCKMNRPCNMEEVIEEMNITPKEVARIERASYRLFYESTLPEKSVDCDDPENVNDYTAYGPSVCKLRVDWHEEQEAEEISADKLELIKVAKQKLSTFEWDVLRAAVLDGKRGWQTRIANKYHYSRAATGIALSRLQVKLDEMYFDMTGKKLERIAS